jgi:predicted nucleotide-binding protein (sugar kinase/HSP70/actin superfamily)
MVELYERPARAALARTNGKFAVPEDVHTLATRAQDIIELGTQAGEGWLLVAEMMELIEHGTPNIICAQPFACLPNHVVGRGMFKELRRRYPHANLVSIDYDPGASEVNQLNRIKLMVATAHKASGESGRLARWDLDDSGNLDDREDRDHAPVTG